MACPWMSFFCYLNLFLQATLNGQVSSLQSTVDRLYLGCEFIERQERYASPVEVLSLKKNITSRMQDLLAFMPDSSASSNAGADLEFVSNFQVSSHLTTK